MIGDAEVNTENLELIFNTSPQLRCCKFYCGSDSSKNKVYIYSLGIVITLSHPINAKTLIQGEDSYLENKMLNITRLCYVKQNK